MGSLTHLARRFVGSLRPGGPSPSDREWAGEQLLAAELDLWSKMSGPDRRHSVGVARRVERSLGHEATRPVLAAALLHDVGKSVSGLRTYGRVVASLSAMVGGHELAEHWSGKRGFTRKVGLYLRHDELGADLLRIAGSDPVTVAWAREHHWPEEMWTVDNRVAHALKAADDD